ncbi:MAG: potassium channel family protein [Frankiaceae bacterium]|nr:potassium channel family protein [Frankiaceae bacterium]
MHKGRLEAFSDAVIAIVMTIMVLELRPPHGTDIAALRPVIPIFLTYLLSFVNLGIYWNNHHHLLQATRRVNGGILWANMHLLFWLSLFPFATAWMGENRLSALPAAAYGTVSLLAAIAYFILQNAVVAEQGADWPLAAALGRDIKGKISPILYAAGIGLAFVHPWIGLAFYIVVALIWLVPDTRIERVVRATAIGD